MRTFGKFLKSSTSLLSISFRLWKPLNRSTFEAESLYAAPGHSHQPYKTASLSLYLSRSFFFGNSSPELSIDGLRCLFFMVGSCCWCWLCWCRWLDWSQRYCDGLWGRVLILGFMTVQFCGSIFRPGGVLGGFNGLGEDRVEREDTGMVGKDF